MGPDDSSAVHAVIWWESMASWKAIGPDTEMILDVVALAGCHHDLLELAVEARRRAATYGQHFRIAAVGDLGGAPAAQTLDRLSQTVLDMGGKLEVVDGPAATRLGKHGSIAALLRY